MNMPRSGEKTASARTWIGARKRNAALGLLAIGAAASVAVSGPSAEETKSTGGGTRFNSPAERAAYAMGVSAARSFSFLGFSEREYSLFAEGLRDQRAGNARVQLAAELANMESFQKQRSDQRSEQNRASNQAFLDEAKKAQGAKVLPSGAVLQLLSPGSGRTPELVGHVTVNFSTYLPDGTLVDSSEARGGKQRLPFNQVMNCWVEALKEMRPGARARLSCPDTGAYGAQGLGSLVPPGSPVRFDLELLAVDFTPSLEDIHKGMGGAGGGGGMGGAPRRR
jgi:FKBP-type peptidyl-prolyl cis-trans isomerase FkpA